MKKAILLLVLIGAMLVGAQHYENVNILIWDDDKGATFRNPDNLELFIGYEANLKKSLYKLGFEDTLKKNLRVSTTLPSWKDLVDYAAVFVVCGPRLYTDEIMTPTDLSNLRGYLENGGCLYIEGNNVAHFLTVNDKYFLNMYFNNSMSYDGGTTYTGYDTIITDSNSNFCPPYVFVYPSGTNPDYSVDGMEPYQAIPAPYYYSVLVPGEKQGKLYKSTATAYTPPATKAPHYFPGKTFMQTTAFGAYSYPVRKQVLPDSIENQLIRTAYLRDILRFFSIGRVLVVKDDGEIPGTEVAILKTLDKYIIDYDVISIKLKEYGPPYYYYTPYTTVLWYTGEDSYTISPNDTTALGTYLTYGGKIIMSGDNIAEDLGIAGVNERGTEFPFLETYFAVDYISSKTDEPVFSADKSSPYFMDSLSKYIEMKTKTSSCNDILRPFLRDTFVDTAFYEGVVKAPAPVGIINNAVTHKAVFLGFAFEYLYPENLDGFLYTTFEEILNYDLAFLNTGTTIKETKFAPAKQTVQTGIVNYADGYIFVSGITDAKVIDVMGREITTLKSGYTKLSSLCGNGIYFVVGRCNNEIVIKSFVKL
ncbi:MAG: hypothetical protein AB7T10_03190 [bacterium]